MDSEEESSKGVREMALHCLGEVSKREPKNKVTNMTYKAKNIHMQVQLCVQ